MKPIYTIEDYKNQLISYVTNLTEMAYDIPGISLGFIFASNDVIKYLNNGFNKSQTIIEFKMEVVQHLFYLASFKGQKYFSYCDCLKVISL